MTIDLTAREVAAIVQWAEKTPEIEAVLLFGSRAKGTSKPDSDADLALVIYENQFPLAAFIGEGEDWQNHLRAVTGLAVNIDLLDGENTPRVVAFVKDCSVELFRRADSKV